MQRTTGNIIADSLESAVGYADRLRQDIPHIEAARFARPGGHMVSSNHPCFIFGHLSLYPPKVLGQLDQKSLQYQLGLKKLSTRQQPARMTRTTRCIRRSTRFSHFLVLVTKSSLKHSEELPTRHSTIQIRPKAHSPNDSQPCHRFMRSTVVVTSCRILDSFLPGVACRASHQPDSQRGRTGIPRPASEDKISD